MRVASRLVNLFGGAVADRVIDVRTLHVRQTAATLGQMEPVTGIMFLNVDDADFNSMFDTFSDEVQPESTMQLLETFWHEAYHCFQTYTTGYLYDRTARIAAMYFRERLSDYTMWLDVRLMWRALASSWLYAASGVLLTVPMRGRVWRKNLAMWLEDGRQAHRYRLLAERSPVGTSTVVDGIMPKLRRKLRDVVAESNVRGADGLSATDLVEGSAVLYAKELVRGETPTTNGTTEAAYEGDSEYSQMIGVSKERFGNLPPPTLRAAAALALRYESPGDAYLPLLGKLASGPVERVVPAARALGHDMPALSKAGELLGTANELRKKRSMDWQNYVTQLDALDRGVWNIDELDLLVEAQAVGSIPLGQLGFAIVTRNGHWGFTSKAHLAWIVLATELLPDTETLVQLGRNALGDEWTST